MGGGTPDCALSMRLPGLNWCRLFGLRYGKQLQGKQPLRSQRPHTGGQGFETVHRYTLGTGGLTTLIGFSNDGPCWGIKAVTGLPVLILPRSLAGPCSDTHCQQGQSEQAPSEAHGADVASRASLGSRATASHSPWISEG